MSDVESAETVERADSGERSVERPARDRDDRPRRRDDSRDSAPGEYGPQVPEGADYAALDAEARAGLRSLPKSLAEMVGKHLVAAGMLIDEDPQRALVHARFARERAARVAIVREAAGLTAYHAGEWAEALSELRAVRRMSGGNHHIAVMADCERALGRPERALELAKEAGSDLSPDVAVELRIVSAGARRDMGQLEAAVVGLQGPDLDPKRRDPWSARLFYAYADNLEAAGRTEDAIRWFLNAAQADDDEDTDAAERAFALGADESEVASALPGETIEIEDDVDPDADADNSADTDDADGGSTIADGIGHRDNDGADDTAHSDVAGSDIDGVDLSDDTADVGRAGGDVASDVDGDVAAAGSLASGDIAVDDDAADHSLADGDAANDVDGDVAAEDVAGVSAGDVVDRDGGDVDANEPHSDDALSQGMDHIGDLPPADATTPAGTNPSDRS
ncbi:hypothetical protein [Alloactinosynnema sp. L-07]|uniref:hypothetical protein n=1 Tax=Alloactinosynnema sp. L-07 TaxID=1653480 RepID=UPI000A428267|nr:hypothetical protein [Alloactinosynnema sp. L-07]